MSDIFTDLAAAPRPFYSPGLPENTVAHHGMAICCEIMIKSLMHDNLLDNALGQYPDYDFVITGHSLGAGLAVLVGTKLRPKFPLLKVYAFSTPSGLLSREAIKYTEQFAFTLVIGDDFAARMNLEAVENLKNGILETLQSCKLPKVSIDVEDLFKQLSSFSINSTALCSTDSHTPFWAFHRKTWRNLGMT